LLQLKPYKSVVIHALQLHDPTSRVHCCSWFLQCTTEDEIDLQPTFFSDEAWFHLHGYINTKNIPYWNSQNPHLTNKACLHPVKVGVGQAVSARRIAQPAIFLREQLIVKDM
jgi:hypothetical protein